MKTTSVGEKIRAALPDVKAGADLEKIVREWLSADADFNVWFLETTKGTRDEAALTEVLAASTKAMAALKLK